MFNIVMNEELNFESKQKVKLVVENLTSLSSKIEKMKDELALKRKKRNFEQLKEISKYGLY